MVIKSGFEGYFGVNKSQGKTHDDFIPEKWGFGVNFRFPKIGKNCSIAVFQLEKRAIKPSHLQGFKYLAKARGTHTS